MNTIPLTQTTPLYADRDGVLRLAGSRILLDLVVYEFKPGVTAERVIPQPLRCKEIIFGNPSKATEQ